MRGQVFLIDSIEEDPELEVVEKFIKSCSAKNEYSPPEIFSSEYLSKQFNENIIK